MDTSLKTFLDTITPRQREVLRLVSDGMTNKEVAESLCIAPSVVAEHLTNIYAELDIHLASTDRPNRRTVLRLYGTFFDRHPDLDPLQ